MASDIPTTNNIVGNKVDITSNDLPVICIIPNTPVIAIKTVSKGTIIRIESCKENYSINSLIDIFAALGRIVVVSTKRFKR